jgi:hypothetical protein
MNRQSIGHFRVEIDPARGTFKLYANKAKEILEAALESSILVGLGYYLAIPGSRLALMGLTGKALRLSSPLVYLALRVLVLSLSAGWLYLSLRTFQRIAWQFLHGIPPTVFDRVRGLCRESKGYVFRLDGLAYLDVKQTSFSREYGPDKDYYQVQFHFKSGKKRACGPTFAEWREDCELLASALADFLGVRTVGLKTSPSYIVDPESWIID